MFRGQMYSRHRTKLSRKPGADQDLRKRGRWNRGPGLWRMAVCETKFPEAEVLLLYNRIFDMPRSLITQEIIRRWDTRTWRDVSSYLFTYLPPNYDTLYFQNIFLSRPNDNSYISNGRIGLRKAPCVSTFRVSSINYSLACSLPIHTRSSANAEGPQAHCQLKSRKMPHKCSTDGIWKCLQPVNDFQDHSRSPPLLPFDRPYTISY